MAHIFWGLLVMSIVPGAAMAPFQNPTTILIIPVKIEHEFAPVICSFGPGTLGFVFLGGFRILLTVVDAASCTKEVHQLLILFPAFTSNLKARGST
jgi:hypothetical protein